MLQKPSLTDTQTTSAQIMRTVCLALIPGLASMLLYSPRWALTLITTLIFAVCTEAVCIRIRSNWFQARHTITDCSALLTGLLIAICLPPASPWWLAAFAGMSSIGIGKHLYGGLGANPFNPAMVGYIMLLLGFPHAMSSWGDAASDSITSATLLDRANLLSIQQWHSSPLLSQNKIINTAFALGGLLLLWRKIIHIRIPAAVIFGFIATQLILHSISGDSLLVSLENTTLHFWVGSIIIGAFYIATDPVSAPLHPKTQILYGLGIGVLTAVIRNGSQYPDGFAFAVLMMNILSPSLDRLQLFTRRKTA